MNDTEEAARRLFAAAAEDVPPGIDLLHGVQARSRARRARTRAVLAVGTAGIVTAAAAITLSAVRAPSASAQVTQAAARMAEQSYRVSSATSVPGDRSPVTVTGEFDPARKVGEETSSFGQQFRYIGSYVYLRETPAQLKAFHVPAGKLWLKIPLPPRRSGLIPRLAQLGAMLGGLQEVEPQDLLALLESASQVQEAGPASGPGWTGSAYTFTAFGGISSPGNVRLTVSGTVDVDQQGLVRRLDVVEPMAVVTWKFEASFSDFGVPVSVSPPPASEIYTFSS